MLLVVKYLKNCSVCLITLRDTILVPSKLMAILYFYKLPYVHSACLLFLSRLVFEVHIDNFFDYPHFTHIKEKFFLGEINYSTT